MDAKAVFIGMDLGSFKTSVASSTGIRDVTQTAVGWPKDPVARTMLGRDVVFGKDLVEHRLALEVVRPFEKAALKFNSPDAAGVPAANVARHKEAARLLVEHAVALTRPPKGVPVYVVISAPSRASVLNKKVLLEAAATAFEAAMIVSEPFRSAYGMNRLSDTLVVDIAAGTIDICPVYGTFPKEEVRAGHHPRRRRLHRRLLPQGALADKLPKVQVSLNMASGDQGEVRLRPRRQRDGHRHPAGRGAADAGGCDRPAPRRLPVDSRR
ncbi:MAG: hypothetical protein U0736_17680 [Gemmataceae bacterium]